MPPFGGIKTLDDTIHETPVSPLLSGAELTKEWQGVKAMLKGCYRQLSLQDFCKKFILKHQNMYPNFARLAEIGLCMEVTSVECERSFSTQNRLKTKYRAALKDESLEALMTVGLLGPPVTSYNPAKSVRIWLKRKDRRKKRLMEAYKPRANKETLKK
ncbi:zinc finger protein 862-like [Mercenaria mercenaria]|uniref:zinc finger protein 862-like n=1 Tax=Mercenaria mercenaria TaxID=6596 RepID=UPI00234EE179|nr:zinc finger protein 862-like [Mercenaria mercenaria]